MKKLTAKDAEKYLQFGGLCQPFLDDEYVRWHVADYKRYMEEKRGKEVNTLLALCGWIRHRTKGKGGSGEEKMGLKFRRTAKEIFESGFVTGCTDNGVLFATFAKQLGIPCTVLNTAAKSMIDEIAKDGVERQCSGHTFCECFFEGRWVLVDPTKHEVIESFDLDKLVLPYTLGGNQIYYPYKRGAFKQLEKGGAKEHCVVMRKEILKMLKKDAGLEKNA